MLFRSGGARPQPGGEQPLAASPRRHADPAGPDRREHPAQQEEPERGAARRAERVARFARRAVAGRHPRQSAGETSRHEPERISQGPRSGGEVAPMSGDAPGGPFHPASAPDYLPLAQMRQLQLQRLRSVVRRAYDRVELFRQRLDERSFPPDALSSLADIQHLPFTTKADLRDTYPFDALSSLADIHHLPL